MSDITDDIMDLIKQATTERSHFYTAGVLKRALAEIIMLRTVVSAEALQSRSEAIERAKSDKP